MSASDFNLYRHFSQNFAVRMSKELLCTSDNQSYTYSEIEKTSARIANVLSDLGASCGDRISVQVEKSPASLCLYLACLRAGLVFHPLNMSYKKRELEYFLGDAEPTLVVCDPANLEMLFTIASTVGAKQVVTMDAGGDGTLADMLPSAAPMHDIVPQQADSLAALLYSSGTTGQPKGIMLTHSNLLRNTEVLVNAWGFTADDRLLHALPIYHVHGLFVALGCVLLSGSSMRWLPSFNADDVIQFLPECSVLMGVPTYYTRLLEKDTFTADVTKSVRLFVSGSAPLLEETFNTFEARTGQRILERYGMTETNMNTSNPLHGERRAGTVGPPLPGIDVRITNDSDEVLPTGEIGNLQVRGPNVFAGYWKMPDKTSEDFTGDGFFRTGDNGLIDADGYVSIVGRAKDMVITGGLNVYPKEIELFLDGLDGVFESAVIGVPHRDFGEVVVAVIVPVTGHSTSENEIIAACKDQLADFKVPKRAIFIEALPRNTMAKVQKNALRATYQDLLRT